MGLQSKQQHGQSVVNVGNVKLQKFYMHTFNGNALQTSSIRKLWSKICPKPSRLTNKTLSFDHSMV